MWCFCFIKGKAIVRYVYEDKAYSLNIVDDYDRIPADMDDWEERFCLGPITQYEGPITQYDKVVPIPIPTMLDVEKANDELAKVESEYQEYPLKPIKDFVE